MLVELAANVNERANKRRKAEREGAEKERRRGVLVEKLHSATCCNDKPVSSVSTARSRDENSQIECSGGNRFNM